MVLLPNFVVPNPLDHINEALIFFQNIADIKNLAISNNLLNHEYTEIRFKVINSDLEKEKKFIIGCLKYFRPFLIILNFYQKFPFRKSRVYWIFSQ